MTVEEGCFSLKLECALRDLGFVEIGWKVIAHAGLFYVEPFTIVPGQDPLNDLFGFQLLSSLPSNRMENCISGKVLPTAKRALDLALSLS